jgi:hypothetical protein
VNAVDRVATGPLVAPWIVTVEFPSGVLAVAPTVAVTVTGFAAVG